MGFSDLLDHSWRLYQPPPEKWRYCAKPVWASEFAEPRRRRRQRVPFSVKGTKEVAYAVFNALTDPANSCKRDDPGGGVCGDPGGRKLIHH